MKNILFTALVLVYIFSACVKDVTVPIQPYTSKVSIQCLITPGETPQVFVYRTVPFFSAAALPKDLFLEHAVVTLATSEGMETLLPDSSWNEFRCHFEYFFSSPTPVVAGKTYTLTVFHDNQSYSATATTDRRVVQLDSVTYTPSFRDLYGNHEGVIPHFKDPAGAGEYYRFTMSRTFPPTDTIFDAEGVFSPCALGKTTFLEEIGRTIYPDQHADGTDFALVVEPYYQHKKGQTGYVRLQIVDRAIYEFYDQFDRQKTAQYNPFVEPVFIGRGQFGEEAIGVFGAYAVSDSVLFVYPE